MIKKTGLSQNFMNFNLQRRPFVGAQRSSIKKFLHPKFTRWPKYTILIIEAFKKV